MSSSPLPSDDTGSDFDDIAFTDVVLNLFAILLIFLLIIPLSLRKEDADAPTLNREEMPFFVIRDCYIRVLRPASKFFLIDRTGLTELNYDAMGVAYAQEGGGTVQTPALSADVSVMENGRDANNFKITSSVKHGVASQTPVMPLGEIATWKKYLETTVYSRGYVPFFDVKQGQIGVFSELYNTLIAEGKRFRWRLSTKTSLTRYRAETMFEVGALCR